MAKLPLVTEDEGQIQDLGELTRNLRLALLVTDAVLPLPDALNETRLERLEQLVADRSQLRGVAFRTVLRELTRFEYSVRPADLGALLNGRVPEPGEH